MAWRSVSHGNSLKGVFNLFKATHFFKRSFDSVVMLIEPIRTISNIFIFFTKRF